jgi:hypothetical protein
VTTIHFALFPAKTRAILEQRAQQNMVQEQPIYLINDLPETFEVYRLFLYTGKIFSNNAQTDQDRADNGLDETHGDREWMRFAHLHLMGLDLDDEKICNTVLDALVEKVAETVSILILLLTSRILVLTRTSGPLPDRHRHQSLQLHRPRRQAAFARRRPPRLER